MKHAQYFSFWAAFGIYSLAIYLLGYSQGKEAISYEACKTPVTYIEYPNDSLTKQTINSQAQYFVYTDSGITKSNLLLEITKENILFPNIAEAQCFLETGHLKCDESQCCLRYNNLFGFRHENYISKENPMGYLFFKTQKASIIYYKKWQDKHWDSTKYKNYYECLDKCWGADSLYVKHLMQF